MRDNARKVRTAYGIFFGALTAVVGVLFIVGAAEIYFGGASSGGDIYSRAVVGERLKSLLIPACTWLVAAVGGGVIAMLCPPAPAKRRPDARKTLSKLSRRIPEGNGKEYLAARKEYEKYGLIRTLSLAFVALFGIAAAVATCVYVLDAAHFTAAEAGGGINGDIIRMLRNVLPWIGVAFVLAVAAAVLDIFIAPKALSGAKKLIALGKGTPPPGPSAWAACKSKTDAFFGSKWTVFTVRLAIAALGVVFVALGIANGSAGDVLGKAVMICTECIGLG